MPDEVQHITALGLDAEAVFECLIAIEEAFKETGLRLKALAKNDWDVFKTIADEARNGSGVFKQQAQAAVAAVEAIQKNTQAIRANTGALGENAGAGETTRRGSERTSVARRAETMAINALTRASRELFTTMKEVETEMVDIARVLELNAGQTKALRGEIFGLANDYAREFGEASDITLRFAQAGYSAQESLELTQSALLAMNTAELNANNSTQSMIGILQQWGYEADELITVIDKLNYTADNNAVTTQDLVDGLLRSSSAAKNAKFSFDETVGAMVALREASGRTGREVGTALNSMIAYTTRDRSLSVFEGMGIDVWADKAKGEMNSVMDIWGQMAEMFTTRGNAMVDVLMRNTDMNELYSTAVAEAAGAVDEYNAMLETEAQLQGELSDAERKQLTEQFGTYRRNYMISLLENFGKIQEVVDGMDNSIGHSARENARYMETMEAKLIQLKTSLQELAVQAGEAGLMDLAKGAISAASAVAQFAKNTGGILPIMIQLTGLIAILKREKVNTSLRAIKDQFDNLITTLSRSVKQLKTAYTEAGGGLKGIKSGAEAARKSLKEMWTGLSAATQIGITLFGVATAIQLVTGLIEEHNRKIQESIEKANELAEAFKSDSEAGRETLKTLEGMAEEIERLSHGVDAMGNNTGLSTEDYERYKAITEEIVKLQPEVTGYREVEGELIANNNLLLQEAIGLQQEYNQEVINGLEAHGTEIFEGLGNQIKEARAAIRDIALPRDAFSEPIEALLGSQGWYHDEFRQMLDELGIAYIQAGTEVQVKYYSDLVDKEEELLTLAKKRFGIDDEAAMAARERIALIREEVAIIDEAKQTATEYLQAWAKGSANEGWYDNIQSGYMGAFNEGLSNIYNDPNMTGAQAKIAAEELGKAFVVLSGAIPSSEIEELQTLLAEGTITTDAFAVRVSELETRLLAAGDGSDTYAAAVAAVITLLGDYGDVQERVQAMTEEGAEGFSNYEEAATAAEEELKTLAGELKTLESAMQTLADGEYLSLDAVLALIDAYPRLANCIEWTAEGFRVNEQAMYSEQQAAYAAMAADYALIWAKEAVANSNYTENASLDALFTALRNATSASEAQAAMNQILAQSGYDAAAASEIEAAGLAKVNAVLAGMGNYGVRTRTVGGGGGGGQDPRIKELQDLQREVEKSYKAQEDAVRKRYDAEIDALRRLKEENSRKDDRADYEKSREELLAEKADLEKRTSREAVERLKEIEKELARLDEEERRRQRDNAIDDQIADIEAKRDAELEAIRAAAEAAKESYQAQIAGMQAAASAAGGASKKITEYLINDTYRTKEEVIKWFNEMYDAATKDGSIWAQTQLANNAAVLASITELAQYMDLVYQYQSLIREGRIPGTTHYTPITGPKPPGYATGGYVAEAGPMGVIANLHRGEIIVRKDISDGLLRVIEFMNGSLMQQAGYARRNYPAPAATPTQVIIQGPLQNIERQEIADHADARRGAADAGELLMREVERLT